MYWTATYKSRVPFTSSDMAASSESVNDDGIPDASSTYFTPTNQGPQFPHDWDKIVHLNGSIYYFHPGLRLLTTDNVVNHLALRQLLKVYHEHIPWVEEFMRQHPSHGDAELLIAHHSDLPSITLASWNACTTYACAPDKSRVDVQSQPDFWAYVARYPTHHTHLPDSMQSMFLSTLALGANERVLDVKTTTFPFEDTQILRLTQVYLDLKASGVPVVPTLAQHIATVMCEVEKTRARYGHGTSRARLHRDVAIPAATWPVRFVDIAVGLLFCGTHTGYRTRLQRTVPQGLVFLPDFRRLMQNMMAEWADSNLVATVFVSVNVGFLAVPGITPLERALALVSSLCAMASIVTGLHHVWQHRAKTSADIEDATNYLHVLPRWWSSPPDPAAAHRSGTNLTLTACLLALPLATLQWSVLSFTAAIAAFALQSTPTPPILALLVLLGTLAGAAFVFFLRIWRPPLHREMEAGLDANVVDTATYGYADPDPHAGTPSWGARLQARIKGMGYRVRQLWARG
ncbi:hypothetical protein B0H15DRAFT_164369 [Mycena belliarum]|uniref:Uncharacterized protein n=1 Tax=Mycena belliarum TaxID=1033014 RepID=A0AAD6UBM9_9AGAR|nr:hypothetical protein B0H15DRAFT_164369 [Mycena belliae]